MADTVIRAEKLGKKFIIGHYDQRDTMFREAMVRGVRNFWRRGADLLRGRPIIGGDSAEEFWALRDIDFEIRRGELVSIIGHNGAGKSTLLKVLSRITEPTEGRIEINGRVTSLLEVGTGFHPELTGRENVFLNGAILGMTRVEVRRRFDEIVDFAGVEKFIDTPVKRYSVGMYCRLAFAVAAHLESEILVIDEVLAVGDAEFQAKCLNRMSEVASGGRTVLFVSHNFSAVRALTRRAIVLRNGRLSFDGPVDAALANYTAAAVAAAEKRSDWGKGRDVTLVSADLIDRHGVSTVRYEVGSPLRFRVAFETNGVPGTALMMVLRDEHNAPVGYYASTLFSQVPLPTRAGRYECIVGLEPLNLAAGNYSVDLKVGPPGIDEDHRVDNAVRFMVEFCSPNGIPYSFSQEMGEGTLALMLSEPLEFTAVPAPATASPGSG
jgi:lipopolysaccharide transport system ATP-binding protein